MMIYSIGILILRRTVQIQFPSGYSTGDSVVLLAVYLLSTNYGQMKAILRFQRYRIFYGLGDCGAVTETGLLTQTLLELVSSRWFIIYKR